MASKATSYSSQGKGAAVMLSEGVNLYRAGTRRAASYVQTTIARCRQLEAICRAYDLDLQDKRLLDVGAGQRLTHMHYFARNNDVTGIDRDVIAQGFDPLAYLRMWRLNGPRRVAKTVARKTLGLDRALTREVARVLDIDRPSKARVLRMDGERMDFPDAAFDVVYSMSVLGHVADPGRVLAEMVRVCRPGGVVYVNFLLWTSITGSLDVRIFGSGGVIPWAHLRTDHDDSAPLTTFSNRLRLGEWRSLVEEQLPGAEFLAISSGEPTLREAEALQAAGQLTGYEIDELATGEVTFYWRKP